MNKIWPISTEIWFRTDKKCGRTDDVKTISLQLRRGKSKMLMANDSFMKVESITECSPCITECSPWSILLYFWPALSEYWSWKPIFSLFESGCFTQILLYLYKLKYKHCLINNWINYNPESNKTQEDTDNYSIFSLKCLEISLIQ